MSTYAAQAAACVGCTLMTSVETAERGRMLFFSRTTGQTDPVYLSDEAAAAAGYRALVAPPTFLLALELEQQDPRDLAKLIGFNPSKVLHAEQGFEFFAPVCAGDRLHFEARLAQSYEKKGGALLFLVRETRVTDDARNTLALLRRTTVVTNP